MDEVDPVSRSTEDRERQVASTFVALADSLVADYDVIELLTLLVGRCVELLGADAAGIMLADPTGQLRLVASSSEDARLIELMQLQADQGPCLDCYRTAAAVKVADLADAGGRWDRFVAAVLSSGAQPLRSVHSLPLRLRGSAIGALNMFRRRPGEMPEMDLALGQALADVATIAILQERAIRRAEVLNEQLQSALTSRVIIEQAKGVLAQSSGLGMEEVFERMRTGARGRNQRLSDVARAVVERRIDPVDVLATDRPKPA